MEGYRPGTAKRLTVMIAVVVNCRGRAEEVDSHELPLDEGGRREKRQQHWADLAVIYGGGGDILYM